MQLSPMFHFKQKIHLPHQTRHIHWGRLAQTAIVVLSLIAIWLTLHYLNPAPPDTLTIATGAPGSAYDQAALKYRDQLAKNGITLKILHTQGAVQNLKLLDDPNSGVDVALVQSGLEIKKLPNVTSLGSMFYQPLMIFYRSPKPLIRLSELSGKRVAVGAPGSGTRYIARHLLTANGLNPDSVQQLDLEGDPASQALLNHEADAIFLTGDSAAPATIRNMLHQEGVRLFDFTRADAYLRRFTYLHKIIVPAGGFDIGEDLPAANLTLLAPMVEMLARPTLHPALTELLVEAATNVHSRTTTALQTAGEFPKPITSQFPLNDSADRYYKAGDLSLLYRYVRPFWLASLVNRLWVTGLSMVVIVLPALRYAPSLYSWRIENKIHHRYSQLMALERESVAGGLTDERRAQLIVHLNEIEHALINFKIPGSHAEQLYVLRQHINFVRAHLTRPGELTAPPAQLPTPAALSA